MNRTAEKLRSDVERIWWAGVRAAMPSRLIPENVIVDGDSIHLGDEAIDLRQVGRIAVVGAGKASGAMAVALERALGPRVLAEKQVAGWVNVPADCIVPTERIRLHAARPPGVNEPRSEGAIGTERILEIVSALGPSDLCICLLSGGGSALLPAPIPGVSLDEKIRLTRLLSAAGANIEKLNAVRRPLSLVKGGGLARACRAGRLVSLIISDVPGDPLEAIASGPTVDVQASLESALEVLRELRVLDEPKIENVVARLREMAARHKTGHGSAGASPSRWARVSNILIGNNALAVDAAGIEAERLGYSHAMIAATAPEGSAESVGEHLAGIALRMRDESGPDCLVSGGEPTVRLVAEAERGRGGRNQQLALAALRQLGDGERIAIVSGGTDGEDGPTDAAGGVVTAEVVAEAKRQGLDPSDHLRRNDAYSFFAKAGGLFKTGPTQTNVCDLRVVAVTR